jgi:hypothetical protein
MEISSVQKICTFHMDWRDINGQFVPGQDVKGYTRSS